jgi:hypothetical protein
MGENFNSLNLKMDRVVFQTKEIDTQVGGNSYTVTLKHKITTSNPLFIQLQSNASSAFVKNYFVTKPGEVLVILSEPLPSGKWKLNILYCLI